MTKPHSKLFIGSVVVPKGAAILLLMAFKTSVIVLMEKIFAQMLNVHPNEIKDIKSKIDENSNETIFQITHGETITNLKLSEVTNYVRNRLNRMS